MTVPFTPSTISSDTLEHILATNNAIAAYLYEYHPPSQWAEILELFLLGGFREWKRTNASRTMEELKSWALHEETKQQSSRLSEARQRRDGTRNVETPAELKQKGTSKNAPVPQPQQQRSRQPLTAAPPVDDTVPRTQKASKKTTVSVQKTVVGSVYQKSPPQMQHRPATAAPAPQPEAQKRRAPTAWDVSMSPSRNQAPPQKRRSSQKTRKIRAAPEDDIPLTPTYNKEQWMSTFVESRREFQKNKEKNRSISPGWGTKGAQRRRSVDWEHASDSSEHDADSPRNEPLYDDARPHHAHPRFSHLPADDPHNDILLRDLESETAAKKRLQEEEKRRSMYHRSPRRVHGGSAPSADTSVILRDLESDTAMRRRQRQHSAGLSNGIEDASFAKPTFSWKSHVVSPKHQRSESNERRRRPFQPVKFGLPYDLDHVESRIKSQVQFDKQYKKVLEKQQQEEAGEHHGSHHRPGTLPTPEIYASPPKQRAGVTLEEEQEEAPKTRRIDAPQQTKQVPPIPLVQSTAPPPPPDASQILDNFFNEALMKEFYE